LRVGVADNVKLIHGIVVVFAVVESVNFVDICAVVESVNFVDICAVVETVKFVVICAVVETVNFVVIFAISVSVDFVGRIWNETAAAVDFHRNDIIIFSRLVVAPNT
jgi:hypothetical protein